MAQIETSQQSGVTVIKLSGELSQPGVPMVQADFDRAVDEPLARISDGGSRGLVIDLSGVHMLTTPGIALLLAAHGKVGDAGGTLVFTGVRGLIAEVLLDRCRLDLVLTLAPNIDAAVAAARGAK